MFVLFIPHVLKISCSVLTVNLYTYGIKLQVYFKTFFYSILIFPVLYSPAT